MSTKVKMWLLCYARVVILIASIVILNTKVIFYQKNWKKILDKIKDKHFIILNGIELIIFSEYYELYKENFQSRILTNGLALIRKPYLYATLKENGINKIALSYYFGIHDDIFAVKSSMMDDLIEFLVRNGFQVKLMTTVLSDNYKMISAMCNKTYELGAKIIKFTN